MLLERLRHNVETVSVARVRLISVRPPGATGWILQNAIGSTVTKRPNTRSSITHTLTRVVAGGRCAFVSEKSARKILSSARPFRRRARPTRFWTILSWRFWVGIDLQKIVKQRFEKSPRVLLKVILRWSLLNSRNTFWKKKKNYYECLRTRFAQVSRAVSSTLFLSWISSHTRPILICYRHDGFRISVIPTRGRRQCETQSRLDH